MWKYLKFKKYLWKIWKYNETLLKNQKKSIAWWLRTDTPLYIYIDEIVSDKSMEVAFSHQFMYRFRTKSNSYEIVSPILLLYL